MPLIGAVSIDQLGWGAKAWLEYTKEKPKGEELEMGIIDHF